MTGPQFLSPGKAAARIGVTRSTVWRWCESGKLPAIKTPGGQYRIRAVDIDKYAKGGH